MMVPNIVFGAVLLMSCFYFIFQRRSFDLFLVAFGGCAFYFAPLLVGAAPARTEPPTEAMVPLTAGTYVVGCTLMLLLLLASVLFDRGGAKSARIARSSGAGLSVWYLSFAALGLTGAIKSGAIFNLDKTEVLTEVGYWFVLFETAAALAIVDAYWHRARWQLSAGILLLAVDILVGFRMITIIAFLACALLSLGRLGRIELWRKIPILCLSFGAVFVAMLTINPLRYAVLPNVQEMLEAQPASRTISSIVGAVTGPAASTSAKINAVDRDTTPIGQKLYLALTSVDLVNTEPFATQLLLSEIIRNDFSCAPSKVLNVAYVIPFMGYFLGSPPQFETEYKDALFPGYKYGLAGSIWGESFCRFGYGGVATALLLFLALVSFMQIGLFRLSGTIVPALALSGIFLAFYIHRNDLLFEMLLIRRIFMVFAGAWILQFVALNIGALFSRPRQRVLNES